jgi:hypothetical protein
MSMTTLPIVTLATAKTFLNLRDSNIAHDATINLMVIAASAEIEHAIGRTLAQAVQTERFNTRRTSYVALDLGGESESGTVSRATRQSYYLSGLFPDVTAGVKVWYDPGFTFDDSSLLKEGSDFYLDWNEMYLTLFTGTASTVKGVKVEYTAGIVPDAGTLETNAPADIKLACLYQTAFLFKRHREDAVGMTGDRGVQTKQSNVHVGAWNAQQGLCQEAQGQIRKYKQLLTGRG